MNANNVFNAIQHIDDKYIVEAGIETGYLNVHQETIK